MKRTLLLALVGVGACETEWTTDGDPIYQVFPFDMLRAWTYESPDPTAGFRLDAFQQAESELVDQARIYTIDFELDCFNPNDLCPDEDGEEGYDTEGDVLFSWKLSADSAAVRFHAAGDEVYDPPVVLAKGKMPAGETVTTESNGVTFTATYVGREPCPAPLYWPEGDTECLRIDLDDGGAGSKIAGSYWAATHVGLSAFQLDWLGAERVWGLENFESEDY